MCGISLCSVCSIEVKNFDFVSLVLNSLKELKMVKTIYQMHNEYRIPIGKLRRMQRNGDLIVSAVEPGDLEKAAQALQRGQRLSTRQLVMLARDKLKIESLGQYSVAAKAQLRALGKVQDEAYRDFPKGIANLICLAAAKSPEDANRLAEWIASAIPPEGCGYHFIAARVLYFVDDHFFDVAANDLARAIVQARRCQPLEGMSATAKGKTRFFRRASKELTFDL